MTKILILEVIFSIQFLNPISNNVFICVPHLRLGSKWLWFGNSFAY